MIGTFVDDKLVYSRLIKIEFNRRICHKHRSFITENNHLVVRYNGKYIEEIWINPDEIYSYSDMPNVDVDNYYEAHYK